MQFDTSKPGGYFAPIGNRNFGVESVVRRHYPHDDMQPEQPNETPPRSGAQRTYPALWYASLPVMIFGIVVTTMFSVRQFKESGTGHTYYEFIIPGTAVAVVGFVLLLLSQQKRPRT